MLDENQREKLKKTYARAVEANPERIEKLLMPLETLDGYEGLSTRTVNCLKKDELRLVGDLVSRSQQEMLRMPDFGRVSLREIEEKILEPLDMKIGMHIPFWPEEPWGEDYQELKNLKEEKLELLADALREYKAKAEQSRGREEEAGTSQGADSQPTARPQHARMVRMRDAQAEERRLRGIREPR